MNYDSKDKVLKKATVWEGSTSTARVMPYIS